ncbi:MAG: succinate dehydrogenase, cytochrome b556 subunit [Gammaproteobacteria bacterium]|nr:succinate dehydrogenase, cytochrome b556 subunit [Gammaproteobacteria bacterium]
MQERPIYLDLRKIRLPMSAFSSISHRLSGIYVFFISMPLFLYLIKNSKESKSSYEVLLENLTTFSLFSSFIVLSVSIFWYHILTGLRHLVMDFFHIGESISASKYTSIFIIIFWIFTTMTFVGFLYL